MQSICTNEIYFSRLSMCQKLKSKGPVNLNSKQIEGLRLTLRYSGEIIKYCWPFECFIYWMLESKSAS